MSAQERDLMAQLRCPNTELTPEASVPLKQSLTHHSGSDPTVMCSLGEAFCLADLLDKISRVFFHERN